MGGAVHADTWTDYDDIGPDLLGYETTYPDLCKRYDLGRSYQGRHLWAIRISDNVLVEEDEPEFKYIATMHGDEIVGTKMSMNLIDWLLTNYGSDPQATNIIDEIDLWIVPLMNPDGYDRSPRTRYNAQGIDLNRNFPEWINGDPNTPDGRGTETQVIMGWSFGQSFTCSANFHGGALVANYPFDNDGLGSNPSPTPDDAMFIYISEEYSYYNSPMWNGSWYHGITNGAAWYSINGGMQDWNYRYMGCNEVTMELGNTKEPSASQIPAFWNENRESMLYYIETCLIGVRGIVTDGQTGLPLAATITVVGRDHEIYTDPDVGDYHRMLMPGSYDLTFEADGYDPLTLTGITVDPGDATRLDVEMWAGAEVTYPNGGETLSAGVPIDVTWTGNPATAFHVQYTDNYGDSGIVTDGFERTFLGPDYATGGGASWWTTTADSHSGSRSARAGDIGDNDISWMTRTVDGGDMSFWYRVDSEGDYDYFNFYIDGDRKLHVSGDVNWTQYSTTMPAGSYTLKWEYDKDASVSSGSDTVWIDDLELVADNTIWTDIIAETSVGADSTPWTPPAAGTDYKVRVRGSYGGGAYGSWGESESTFTVTTTTADGDYDDDGDVDLADFAAFQMCFEQVAAGACGDAFEFVSDGTIDLDDLGGFVGLLTGP